MKKYIYLISPQKIRGPKFYKDLNKLLKIKKIKYFQLRLKKIGQIKFLTIAKKVKKVTDKVKINIKIINICLFIKLSIN